MESTDRSTASQVLLALPLVLGEALLGAAGILCAVVFLFGAASTPHLQKALPLLLGPFAALLAFLVGLVWTGRRQYWITFTLQAALVPLLAPLLTPLIASWFAT